ncbi:MAG: phosphoglucosamine mutase [Gammaproteobacteria bacterium]|nr:phosphoglucosamine mutase [Gammaproteobacteria bacterium]
MKRRYFGTDGVRGRVGKDPMTVEFALRLASAVARVLAPAGGRVMIGKDTRISSYMFESALEAGFMAAGMDVALLGPLPTPGIAYMTQALEADLGVVISASHNPYFDNGIKFFDRHGGKLSDSVELAIEALLGEQVITRESSHLGRARRLESALEQYQRFCMATLPEGLQLDGLKIVVDCAHGAGYKVAPRTLAGLGAEIVPIGCSPNGRNINEGCGSTHPELLGVLVKGIGADLGIAFDGDGDRVVMVDHLGEVVDGDQILYILAADRCRQGLLEGPVVGTQMSNLGLELALSGLGAGFRRAKVGDRYVLELLRETGGQLGGESSGHILCLDKTTTGDGLITALQVLGVMKASGRSLAELAGGMQRFPQVLINVRLARRLDIAASSRVRAAVEEAEGVLGRQGRVLLRPSGTEPVMRVMVEGEDAAEVQRLATRIAGVVAEEAT